MGSDFLKRSKGTRPRSSKATSALRERAGGSQEAEAAASEIGHYIVTEGLGRGQEVVFSLELKGL